MNFINLTPHPVVVLESSLEHGGIVGYTGNPTKPTQGLFRILTTLAPTGKVARAVQSDIKTGTVPVGDGTVTIVRSTYGAPTDLPEPTEGIMLVVSIITAQAAKMAGRTTGDLLVTADPVRDVTGKIIGCQKFSTL